MYNDDITTDKDNIDINQEEDINNDDKIAQSMRDIPQEIITEDNIKEDVEKKDVITETEVETEKEIETEKKIETEEIKEKTEKEIEKEVEEEEQFNRETVPTAGVTKDTITLVENIKNKHKFSNKVANDIRQQIVDHNAKMWKQTIDNGEKKYQEEIKITDERIDNEFGEGTSNKMQIAIDEHLEDVIRDPIVKIIFSRASKATVDAKYLFYNLLTNNEELPHNSSAKNYINAGNEPLSNQDRRELLENDSEHMKAYKDPNHPGHKEAKRKFNEAYGITE